MTGDKFTTGSGNVFLDLGFSEEEAAELTIKSYLFDILQKALDERLETKRQDEVAKELGVDQPIVSKILNDKMAGFSVERIATLLLRLNYDICLAARPCVDTSRTARVIASQDLAIV